MNLTEQLKLMANTSYKDYEGEPFQILLKSGLSDIEIVKLKSNSPSKTLSKELEEILRFTRGFKIKKGFIDEIQFDNFGDFWFEELIASNLTITHDLTGNFWIQEINQKGEWGKIYYVCHDPPVIIKQANSLCEFLNQLHEYLLIGEESFFSKVYDQISFNVYSGKGKLLDHNEALSSKDEKISQFASNYNSDWYIADLRNAKNGEGFRLESNYNETFRLEDELIWALKKYKSIWSRIKELFN